MLTTTETKRLARSLLVDYRSIKAELDGRHVKGRSGERIRAALAALQTMNSATGAAPYGCAPVQTTEAQGHLTNGSYYSVSERQPST